MTRKVSVMADVPGGGVWVTGMGMDRRRFVRTASGLLVAAASVPGCGGGGNEPPPPPPPTPTGTLKIVVTGLGANVTSVTATAHRTDASQADDIVDINVSTGIGTKVVNTGTYQVTLTIPQGYALGASGTNPVTGVTVSENATTEVDFPVVVVAQTGTLAISVSGLQAGATSGGSASAQRTDVGGKAPVPITIDGTGNGSAIVEVGTYTVTYTLPAQYNLGGGVVNPRTGVVVTASTTTTVSFTVVFAGGGGGVPGNIYEYGFENGNFDQLKTGNNQDPTTIGWQFDTTDKFRGTTSVKHNIPVNAANQAYAFFFLLNTPRKALYGRFAYKQGPNFDNSNPIKVFRYLAPSFGTQYGTVMFNANTSNLVQVNPDQIQGSPAFGSLSPNTANPAIRPNASRGQWHWYEFFADYNTDGNYIFKVWQDDVLIIDGVVPRNISPLPNIGTVQIDGTFNSINTAEDVWYDSIGISTQKMGVPS